ncbi:murein biosynthesis integral membrane protein MurJ [uncultured Rothia sp.]|uniref:murein biosynthesis integral membrane protein MurJ n=1 Tax=uncultured Rothia sp. TaxID=316088 RepID=UPI003216E8C2
MARTGAVSSAIMASGTMVSRLLGFVKTILITIAIGSATNVGDVFETANTLPNLIYVLVAGGIFNAVLVPQIIKAAKHDDGGSDFVSRLVTLATLGIGAVALVVVVCAWPIVHTMGKDWTPEQYQLGVIFAFWCFPQIFFYGFYTIIGQVLNARGAFGWFMWSPVLNNVIAIAALVYFIFAFGSQDMSMSPPLHDVSNWTSAQTLVLAGSATLGVAIQALVLLLPLRRLDMKIRPRFGWRGIGLRTSAKLAGWTLATGIVSNIAFLYLTRIATGTAGARAEYAEQGIPILGVASLNYSSMLYSLPHGVIGLSIATYLFNKMSQASQNQNKDHVVAALSSGLRVSSIATIFLAVALIVFSGPVGMLFSGGSQVVGAQIGQAISIIALGGPFLTIAFMMGRVLYAQEDARTPFFIQFISAVIIVVLGTAVSFFKPPYIIFGLVGIYAFQNILAVVLSHVVLKKRLGSYDGRNIVSTYARVALSSFFAGIFGAWTLWLLGGYTFGGLAWSGLLGALISIVVGGFVMSLAYFLFLLIFRVEELDTLLNPLRRKIPFL